MASVSAAVKTGPVEVSCSRMNTTLPFQAIAADVCVAPQLTPEAMAEAARVGFTQRGQQPARLRRRPDPADQRADRSRRQGRRPANTATCRSARRYQTPEEAAAMARLLQELPRPMLMFCRSGARSGRLYRLALASLKPASARRCALRAFPRRRALRRRKRSDKSLQFGLSRGGRTRSRPCTEPDCPDERSTALDALLKLSAGVDAFSDLIGKLIRWLVLASVLISAGNAIIRKVFNISSNALPRDPVVPVRRRVPARRGLRVPAQRACAHRLHLGQAVQAHQHHHRHPRHRGLHHPAVPDHGLAELAAVHHRAGHRRDVAERRRPDPLAGLPADAAGLRPAAACRRCPS